MRRHTLPLLAALTFFAPSLVDAQAPTASAADPVDELRALDRRIKVEFEGLKGPWGVSVDVEKQKLTGARKAIDETRARLDTLQTSGDRALAARMVVEKNLGRLERETLRAERMHAVTQAEAAILAKHRAGAPATDVDVRNLQDAVRALERAGGAGWAETARHATSRVARIEQDRAALTKLASAAAAAQAKRAELDEAMRAANRARRDIEAHLEDSAESIPSDLMLAHQLATDRVVKASKEAGSYYVDEHAAFALANIWREKPGDAREMAIASTLEGTFIDAAVAKTSTLKLTIPADADWCYAVVARFAKDTGDEELVDVRLSTNKGALARFSVPHKGPGWQGTYGACTTDASKIAVSGKISRKGKNDLSVVVVGWPRASFPRSLATYMQASLDDPCDTDAYVAAWTRPVPGAIAYRAGTPVLILSADRPRGDSVSIFTLTGERVFDVKKRELTSTTSARALDVPFSWKGCPSSDLAEHKDSKALAKCHDGVDRLTGAPLRNATLAAERATTDAARERAEREVERLKNKDASERAKKCEPIEEKIRERARRAFDRVLDHHADKAVDAPFDRVGSLDAHMLADPDLR